MMDTRAPISIAEWKAMQTENDRLRADLVDAGAVHLADEQSVRNMERRIESLRAELQKSRDETQAMQDRASDLAASLCNARAQLDETRAEVKEAKRLSEVWRASSFNNEAFHKDDLTRIASLTADLACVTAERDDLKEWKVLNAEFSHDAADECGRLRAERDALLAAARGVMRYEHEHHGTECLRCAADYDLRAAVSACAPTEKP
jgi:vacuolar-type H+-ATPase subunit I/STV1